ncbi:RNA polymerase sigma-70 factor [Cellulophaga lytica]|uniref:RNA polymerase sigma factor n=1 Tax=Cellulophaga lytica TaxID=979 RepID=UPI0032E4120B|nr:RNA polymerase sigma-70 factor [Cellulophaga lytica]
MRTEEDFNLIMKEIQRGNKMAFEVLFNRYYEALVNYAYNYLYDQNNSQDLVQEIFIYIWENAADLKITSSVKGYLFTMTKNRCLNFLKKVNITDNEGVIELKSLFDHDLNYATLSDTELQEKPILKLLDKLPAKMKVIVMLKFFSDYKHQEIAEELDISINTVKTQLKRARIKLSRLMFFIWILSI